MTPLSRLPFFPWSERIYNTPKSVLVREHHEFQQYLSKNLNLKWFEEVTGFGFEQRMEQKQSPACLKQSSDNNLQTPMPEVPKLLNSI